MFSLTLSPLPYAQATPTQRAQLLRCLQDQLRPHFPNLSERAFVRALTELQPDLHGTSGPLTLANLELTQLVQYLSDASELPLLDPPLFGPWALDLAQYLLHSNELAAGVVLELATKGHPRCPPQLWNLLQRLVTPYPLAERIVQARRWDLPSSPRLPAGRPGGGPAPGSPVVLDLLYQLRPVGRP